MRISSLVARDREIWRLAVPALGALIGEPVFRLADSAIVGRLGAAPLAGSGAAAAALATLVSKGPQLSAAVNGPPCAQAGIAGGIGSIMVKAPGLTGGFLAARTRVVVLRSRRRGRLRECRDHSLHQQRGAVT